MGRYRVDSTITIVARNAYVSRIIAEVMIDMPGLAAINLFVNVALEPSPYMTLLHVLTYIEVPLAV